MINAGTNVVNGMSAGLLIDSFLAISANMAISVWRVWLSINVRIGSSDAASATSKLIAPSYENHRISNVDILVSDKNYAEYFESSTGNQIPSGTTVVLDGNNRLLIGGADLVMGFGDNQREILSVSEGSGYFILFERKYETFT